MRFYLNLLILLSSTIVYAQDDFIFSNRIFNTAIASPQVYPESNPLGFPYVDMNGGLPLEFHFDLMGNERQTLNFGVIHCTKDWRKTDAISSQYLIGFPWTSIDDVTSSYTSQNQYYHYQYTFPNSQQQLKYSGNYAAVIFTGSDIEDPANYVLTYRFVVFEGAVGISARVSPSSDVAERRYKQQVDFNIIPSQMKINSPMRDISATVLQNFSWENAVTNLKPMFIEPNQWTFDYSGEIDFNAGSEWRSFEFKNFQFKSLRVQGIMQEPDGRHVYMENELPMGTRTYMSSTDLDGRAYIKNDLGDNSNIDAEYAWVHFALKMPPLSEGKMYLQYAFSDFNPPGVECTYDARQGAYTCKLFLKQGLYNYRYMIEDRYHVNPDLSFTEGDHSETENIYTVIVYYTDMNSGLDRVLQLYTTQ